MDFEYAEKLNLGENLDYIIRGLMKGDGVVDNWFRHMPPFYIMLNQKNYCVKYPFDDCVGQMKAHFQYRKTAEIYEHMFLDSILNRDKDNEEKRKYLPMMDFADLMFESKGIRQFMNASDNKLKFILANVALLVNSEKKEYRGEKVYH